MVEDSSGNDSLIDQLSGELRDRYEGLTAEEQKQFREQLPGRARHAPSFDDAVGTILFDTRAGRRSQRAKGRGVPPLTKTEASNRR